VWGRIVNGRAVQEPAFEIVTRPVLPRRPGAYSLRGTAGDGGRVFDFSFDPVTVADDARGTGHFAFAVPLDRRSTGRLEQIRLSGPGGDIATLSRAAAALRAAPIQPVELRYAAGGIALRWDATVSPMVMVRDASSGQVLSFARGGSAVLPANTPEVELVSSDGVRSSSVSVRR
jgi:hypothetical protein